MVWSWMTQCPTDGACSLIGRRVDRLSIRSEAYDLYHGKCMIKLYQAIYLDANQVVIHTSYSKTVPVVDGIMLGYFVMCIIPNRKEGIYREVSKEFVKV